MPLPVIVLFFVFVLTATRKVGGIRLAIWQVMLGAALIVLVTGSISAAAAIEAIDWDVMFFLFGMFIIGQALEESGYLEAAARRVFSRMRTPGSVILTFLLSAGALSAVLMNDTVAVIGTPVALHIAAERGINPTALLLTLAFGVTIGSAASPIGNPQNLIIALSDAIHNPFGAFFGNLAVPTIINLLVAYLFIRLFYHGAPALPFRKDGYKPAAVDRELSRAACASLVLLTGLIVIKIGLLLFGASYDFPLTAVALIAAVPVVLSSKRVRIVRNIDWGTLVFFASMFIFMQSVWDSGFIQGLLGKTSSALLSTNMIFLVSILTSQLISNVPLVALYLPMLLDAGAGPHQLVALGAGSTIAGNLFVLGAASNVIIIQNAERKTGASVTFWEFARIGIPLTIVNALVYRLFLV